MRLENWEVVCDDPYLSPEHCGRLRGNVYGHPQHDEGHHISTSRIVAASGRLVTTRSGSVYELGEPAATYAAWVKEHLGREIDPNQPVTVSRS